MKRAPARSIGGSIGVGIGTGCAILLVLSSVGVPDGGCGGELEADVDADSGEDSDAIVRCIDAGDGGGGPCLITQTVQIEAEKGASIYTLGTNLGNGKGRYLMAGKQGYGSPTPTTLFNMQSALKFKQTGTTGLSQIPANATITEVRLNMKHMALASPGPAVPPTISIDRWVALRRITADWETSGTESTGTCAAGACDGVNNHELQPPSGQCRDTSWQSAKFDSTTCSLLSTQFWTPIGGTFDPNKSAERLVGAANAWYTWVGNSATNTRLRDDVRNWRNGTSPNFGWMIFGDDTTPADTATLKRFGSDDSANTADKPTLDVIYSVPCH